MLKDQKRTIFGWFSQIQCNAKVASGLWTTTVNCVVHANQQSFNDDWASNESQFCDFFLLVPFVLWREMSVQCGGIKNMNRGPETKEKFCSCIFGITLLRSTITLRYSPQAERWKAQHKWSISATEDCSCVYGLEVAQSKRTKSQISTFSRLALTVSSAHTFTVSLYRSFLSYDL